MALAVAKAWQCGIGGVAALDFGLFHLWPPGGIAGSVAAGMLSLVMGWELIARVTRP